MCDSFSNLVFKVSRMLTKEDLDALAYLYRIPVDVITVGSGSNGLLYLRELEGRGIFSCSNLAGLKETLNNIQRCDLIEIIEEFERDKQKYSIGTQRCSRPQEERVRLDMSYAQAKKTELQLTEFQKKFTAFCSKLGDLPSMPQFYSGMVKRLQQMNHECHQYITLPLCEIIQRSYLMLGDHIQVSTCTNYCHGVRYDETATHFQQNIATSGNDSIATSNHRSLEHSIATNGQASYSPMPQTTPLLNRSLVASYYTLTHSSPNQQGINPVNMDYNTLTPIQIGGEQRAHRDNTHDCVSVHSKSTNSILSKKHTAHHRHSKSLNQVHSGTTQLACTGPVQCNNRRTRNSKSSSAVSAPEILQCRVTTTSSNPLKKAGSADNVLAISSSPSRIPKLHQLTGRQLTTSRESCDYSGRSSCSESDLTSSTESGIEMKACYGRQQPQSSTRMWRNPGDKDYCNTELERQTFAATPIYQRPQQKNKSS